MFVFALIFAKGFAVLPASFELADVVPSASFGPSGLALAAGLVLFLVDLVGGFVRGKLGDPSRPYMKRFKQSVLGCVYDCSGDSLVRTAVIRLQGTRSS